MSARALLVGLALLGVAGCGAMVVAGDGTTTDDGSSSGAAPESSGAPVTTSGGEPSSSSASSGAVDATSTSDDGGYEEDDGGTGCTFTCPNPPPPTPPPGGGGGGGFFECDLQAQDCPEGEKCMPWANDGGSEWNGSRCSPLADDPNQLGDPCLVEGSATSGLDDCDLGLVCWQVDPQTNTGSCHAMCGSEPPLCEPPLVCGEVDVAPMCIQSCDPLDPTSCPQASACGFFMGTALVCQPVLGGATVGMPCDVASPCESGAMCAYDAVLDCGNGVGEGCCAVPCDLGDPVACVDPEVCLPWFPAPPPPELAWLGFCAAS